MLRCVRLSKNHFINALAIACFSTHLSLFQCAREWQAEHLSGLQQQQHEQPREGGGGAGAASTFNFKVY